MQNCLQKKKRRICVKRIVSASTLLLLVFAAVCIVILRQNNRHASIGNVGVHENPEQVGLPPENNSQSAFANAEMNNFMQNNAKINFFDGKTVKSTARCDKVRVLQSDNSVAVMPLEEYVKGCVFGEMPLSFESQALMAQSVAVRTFTVRQVLGTSKHKNADVCTNPACCQNYVLPQSKNISEENLAKLCDAVNATKGIIIVYDGEPIEAVYHASSGRETLDSEDVWGGRLEYLRSVKSPDGETEVAADGMGHRVGMSQHGANILAEDGFGYADILKYYYSGVSLSFLV